MKTKSIFCALLLILAAVSASTEPVLRIHQLQSPLLASPALVTPGADFPLSVSLAAGEQLHEAWLESVLDPSVRFQLKLSGGPASFKAAVPADSAPGLYNLSVLYGKSDWDTQPHAVRVYKEFKKDYDFVQLTDIHFNVQDIDGKNMNRIRQHILQEITKLNPEFVILSGDLMLDPETYDWDYVYGYEQLLQFLQVPVFIVPGNHEQYRTAIDGRPVDGRINFTQAYGPTWKSFDYGNLHFIGMNTFDWSPRWRDRRAQEVMFSGALINACIGTEQREWIKKDLAGRNGNCIAFTHIPVETLQGGKTLGLANKEKVDCTTVDEFTGLLASAGCNTLLVGHMHYDETKQLSNGVTELLGRAAGISIGHKENAPWAFRVFHVRGGKLSSSDYVEFGFKDIDGK